MAQQNGLGSAGGEVSRPSLLDSLKQTLNAMESHWPKQPVQFSEVGQIALAHLRICIFVLIW